MSKQALCIGINDYPGTSSDLTGCANDAADWAKALTERGFTVTTLLDQAATRAAMIAAIRALTGAAEPSSTLVITYSGHGTWLPDSSGDEPDGRDEALCPWGIGQEGGGPLLDDDLRTLFAERAPGSRLIFISDSCHSGSVSKGNDSDLDATAPRARFLPLAAWMRADALPQAAPGHRSERAMPFPRTSRKARCNLPRHCLGTPGRSRVRLDW